MFIELLTIKGFGKISGLSLELEKGLNIIYGSNESGKTTLQWFIRGMLYGLKGGRASRDGLPPPLKRYKPWSGTDYGGSLQYRLDNECCYRVDRDFERNTTAIYDSSFNNITGNFNSGRDRGLMFAERHLGLNELCFDKTVLIRQMETRLDDDGSGELISRLMNLNQTGQEDLSFIKASEALHQALKKSIGTDRTTTQPADRIALRLAELKEVRRKLVEKRDSLISTSNELQELIITESSLKKRKAYLEAVKVPIDDRGQLEEESLRYSKLSEAAVKLAETEKELLIAKDELKKLQEVENSSNDDVNLGASRRQRDRGKIRWFVILPICAAAGAMVISAIRYQPVWLIAAAVLISAAVSAALFTKYRKDNYKEAIVQKEDAQCHLQQYEQKMQMIIALNGRIKDICSEASIGSGKQVTGTESLEAAVSEKAGVIDTLEGRLQKGINAAFSAGGQYESGFFTASLLKDIIFNSNINWLKDSWDYEMERVNDDLVQTALKLKECETLLRGFREDGDQLQSIDEEIAGLSVKKAELEKTGAALRLALDVLTEVSREIQLSFAPGLNSAMSAIIAGITGGRYRDLRADDSLTLNTISHESSDVRSVIALSGGTVDQMYLALRLAMSDLLSRGRESVPLLLDEVFSQYDDKRTLGTMDYLFNEFKDRQVILFTCKEREVETAVNLTGGRINVVRLL